MTSTFHRSARRFDTLFADSEQFLAVLSADGRLERVGVRALEPLGFTPEEALGGAFEDAPWWGDQPGIRNRLRKAIGRAGHESSVQVIMPLVPKVGERREIALSISLIGGDAPAGFLLALGEDVVPGPPDGEVDEASERVRARERRRRQILLATLAHEIRNPLAPIRSGLELLHDADEKEEREVLRRMMSRHVEHIARLIEDLFDLSRLDDGKLALHEDTVEADELVHDALELVRPLTDGRRQAVTSTLPAPAVLLRVDPPRMAQVLSNLLNNAARYTPENGHIDVRVELGEDRVRFVVADDGYGLDEASHERIFEMFVQLPGADGKTPDGLGLGLTLARRLVELHGGTLEVDSAGIGQGSMFTVSLPLARIAAVKTPVAPPSAATPEDPAVRPTALVVDDNRDAADTLAKLLRRKGFGVTTAYTGYAALERVARQAFDAIVLDIGLPDISGHEVAERLRAEGNRTRLVALTGWGAAEDVAKSLEAGFDHHLTKPVTMRRLLEVLGQAGEAARTATSGPGHGS